MLGLGSCCSYVDIKSGALKIDSNGVTNNTTIELLTNNTTFSPQFGPLNFHYSTRSLQTIYGNKYYGLIDSVGSNINPRFISKFSNPLSDTCHSASVYTSTLFTSNLQPYSTPTVQSITSYTINSYNSTITPVSFSVEFKYCTIHDTLTDIGIKKNELRRSDPKISPNPVANKLRIDWGEQIDGVEVQDLTGRIHIQIQRSNAIDVSTLLSGLYLIKLRSGTIIYTSKFIKE